MTTDADILIYALIAIIIVLAVLVIRLELKTKRLLAGSDGKGLEGVIMNIKGDVLRLNDLHKEIRGQTDNIESRMRRNTRRAETVRFNPFKGTGSGGNQSFATALLDEEGNGVVFSSLYSRERVSVFAKPIHNYISEYELSGEEKEAIRMVKDGTS